MFSSYLDDDYENDSYDVELDIIPSTDDEDQENNDNLPPSLITIIVGGNIYNGTNVTDTDEDSVYNEGLFSSTSTDGSRGKLSLFLI